MTLVCGSSKSSPFDGEWILPIAGAETILTTTLDISFTFFINLSQKVWSSRRFLDCLYHNGSIDWLNRFAGGRGLEVHISLCGACSVSLMVALFHRCSVWLMRICRFKLPLPVNWEPQWEQVTIWDWFECLCCLWRFKPSLQLNVFSHWSQGTRADCPKWCIRMCLFRLPRLANTELHSGQVTRGDRAECLCLLCLFSPPLQLKVFSHMSQATRGGCSAWLRRTCRFMLPILVNSEAHLGQATLAGCFRKPVCIVLIWPHIDEATYWTGGKKF